jgi:hypothetical protein
MTEKRTINTVIIKDNSEKEHDKLEPDMCLTILVELSKLILLNYTEFYCIYLGRFSSN